MTRLVLIGALLIGPACGDHGVSPRVSDPALQPVVGQGPVVVSGTVWTYGENGVSSRDGGSIYPYLENTFGFSYHFSNVTRAGSDGRYSVSIDRQFSRATFAAAVQGHQVCATNVSLNGKSQIPDADIHIVVDPTQLGANIPAALRAKGPLLSGVVYADTPEGRRPVPNAWVALDAFGGGGIDDLLPAIADSRTDAQGRYVLCAVPQGARVTLVAEADGYARALGDASGASTLDITLRPRE